MPRWVKVFIVIAMVVAAGLIVTLFAGIEHGPRLHDPEAPPQPSPPTDQGP